MTFGNLMATSEGGTLMSKSITRVHCNFITLLSTKIFQLYRDHLITKSPNFIIAGQGVVTGQCKVGYYCGRGSDREDPTDGVTGDICPAGRYCSKLNDTIKTLGPISSKTINIDPYIHNVYKSKIFLGLL
jgi:hypothetical protein